MCPSLTQMWMCCERKVKIDLILSEHTRILAEHHHCDRICRESIGQGDADILKKKTKKQMTQPSLKSHSADGEGELNLLTGSHSTKNSPEMATSYEQPHAEVEIRRSRRWRGGKTGGDSKSCRMEIDEGAGEVSGSLGKKSSSSVDCNKCCTGANTDKCSRGKANGSKCGSA